jgi:hypothetical protein
LPYHLVPDNISGETIQALRELLQQAEDGEIIGVAFCAMYQRQEYIVNTAGEARRSPTFTSGMVEQLQNYVSSRTHLRDPQ